MEKHIIVRVIWDVWLSKGRIIMTILCRKSMERAQFVRGHLYELSGVPNYPGAKLTDPYCTVEPA